MKRKVIPRFESEDQERKFWASHDSAEYVDWSQGRKIVLSGVRPTLKTISLRLPASLLEELKLLANKRDVPYQSLLKTFLADRVKAELTGTRRSSIGH